MSEMLDIYDEALNHLGVKAREDVHRDGDWHRTFQCWVIYRDSAGDNWIVLQKRAQEKDTFGGYLDISAAGHYEAGESVREGIRELHEELGVYPSVEDLIPLGRRISIHKSHNIVDRQISDVFFYICDQSLNQYQYPFDEIEGLIAIKTGDGLALKKKQVDSICVPAVGFATDEIIITLDDFIPTIDNYFEKICMLAPMCLDGERDIWI